MDSKPIRTGVAAGVERNCARAAVAVRYVSALTFFDVVPGRGLQQHDVVAEIYVPVVARRRRPTAFPVLLRPQPQLLHPPAPGQREPLGRGHALQMRHLQHQVGVVHRAETATGGTATAATRARRGPDLIGRPASSDTVSLGRHRRRTPVRLFA